MDNIEYLYHYTNVDTLALILSTRTIRFNSLDKMDDLQENKTEDLRNAGQFCYISSWTDDKTESIPMWNMYASLDRGVRIKLRKNPFRVYDNCPEQLTGLLEQLPDITIGQQVDRIEEKYRNSIIPVGEMLLNKFYCSEAFNMDLLQKVQYTNDKSLLEPKILGKTEEEIKQRIAQLGKFKNLHWEFQNEWRYIFYAYRFDFNKSTELIPLVFLNDIQTLLHKGERVQPFPYYHLRISYEAFTDMEITLSPCINKGAKLIVKTLIEKYNPNAELKQSSLTGLL